MVNSLNGVLPPDYRELIYGGRTKGVDRLELIDPARTGRPLPSYRKERGRKGLTNYSRTTIRYELTVCQNRLAM